MAKANTVRSRKAKGRRLQNWVAEQISKMLSIPWGKDSEIEGREMGQSGVDVKLYGEAKSLFPFSIECKNTEKWNVPGAVRQAKANKKDTTDWMLFFKRNNEDPVVIMDAKAFFELYERYILFLNPEIKEEEDDDNRTNIREDREESKR